MHSTPQALPLLPFHIFSSSQPGRSKVHISLSLYHIMTISSSESAPSAPAEANKTQNGACTKRHEEYQYLDLVREILEDGEHRPDRYIYFSHQSILNTLPHLPTQDRHRNLLDLRAPTSQILASRQRRAYLPSAYH